MKLLTIEEVNMVAGSEMSTGDKVAVGTALGGATGYGLAEGVNASFAGRMLASGVGAVRAGGAVAAWEVGYAIGTAINDRYGKEIGDKIWEVSERLGGGGGGGGGSSGFGGAVSGAGSNKFKAVSIK